MLIVTFANFFAIVVTTLGRILKNERIFFLLAIVFLIAFYSIRVDYGNDLPDYLRTFERIAYFSSSDLSDKNGERMEPGWIVLNFIFAPLGWQFFLFFLTAFQFYTIYWLITKYVDKKYYWLIFSLYVLNSNLLLTDLSMLRQAFAMHVSWWIIPWILDKKIIKPIIIILLLTTIHTSAYALLILLLIPYISKVNIKVVFLIFIALFTFLIIAEALVGDFFKLIFATESFQKYQIYEDVGNESGIGLGVLLNLLIASWLLVRYSRNQVSKFFNLTLCCMTLLVPFGTIVPLVSRIGMYFSFISIVTYQNLAKNKYDIVSIGMLVMLILITISGYFGFFESPIYKPYYQSYYTIFD